MNTYIALFRGINVGGKHILPMKELTSILEETGCKDVRTYIQSGNIVFWNDKKQRSELTREIGSCILERFGFEPKVLILEPTELQDAVDNNPYKVGEGKSLHFYFLDSPPEQPDLERLNSLKAPAEKFTLNKKVFYLYAPDGIGRSKLAANVEQAIGVTATARNWNTVNTLLAMIDQV